MAEKLSPSSLLDRLANDSLLWRVFLEKEKPSKLSRMFADVQDILHGQIPWISRKLRKTEQMNKVSSTLLHNINQPGIGALIDFLERDQQIEAGPPTFPEDTIINLPGTFKKIVFALGYEMHRSGINDVDDFDLHSIIQELADTTSGMVAGKNTRDFVNTMILMGIVLPGFLEKGLEYAKSGLVEEEMPQIFTDFLENH